MLNSRRSRISILSTAACLVTGPAVLAQTSPDAADLQTVTVSAQKQPFRGDTPLKDLPQSVQVIDGELLQDMGVIELDNALDFASGVARQNSFGGLWDSFAMRGFAGDENVPTGYLVNGFNAGRGFSGRRDASSIENIEFLKGPGSALYGRAEPGGTINLVTKKPQFETKGGVELSAGRYDTYRVAADFTSSIGDRFAYRINGAYQDADSFRDTLTSEKTAVTPSFLVKFSDATLLTYELEYLKQEAFFDRGIVAVNGALGVVPVSRFLGEPNDGPTEIDALGHQLVLQHQLADKWALMVGAAYRDSTFKGFSSDAELTASRQLLFATGTQLSRQRRYRDYSADDLQARVELSGSATTGPLMHHILMGVDAYNYELDQLQLRFRPGVGSAVYSINIFNPVYGQTPPPLSSFQNRIEEQKAYGAYLQDQIDLTEQWKVLIGARYDDFTADFTDRLTNISGEQSDTAFSPRAGVVYEPNPMVSLYASYSKGFRPNSGADFAGNAFRPENSRSYEVGTKLQTPDGRISATLAVYKAEKTNILTADTVNAGFSLTAGEAESKGLEIDIAGRLMDSLRASFSYAYTDAELTKSVVDFNFGLPLVAGSPLLNIPEHSGNVLLIRDFEVKSATFSVGASATYVGERLGETGRPDFTLPSYTLVNLMGSYAPTESLKLVVDVDNVFDKTYYPSSYARLWVNPGSPRMYTVRAQYSF